MANLGPFALLYVAVAGIAIAMQASGKPAADDEPEPTPGSGGAGPGKPVLQGGEVVSRGFKSNAYGVKITFQIERVAGGVEGGDGAEFFGVVFEPWAQNNPALVAQGTTRNEARDKTVAFIDANEHGSP